MPADRKELPLAASVTIVAVGVAASIVTVVYTRRVGLAFVAFLLVGGALGLIAGDLRLPTRLLPPGRLPTLPPHRVRHPWVGRRAGELGLPRPERGASAARRRVGRRVGNPVDGRSSRACSADMRAQRQTARDGRVYVGAEQP